MRSMNDPRSMIWLTMKTHTTTPQPVRTFHTLHTHTRVLCFVEMIDFPPRRVHQGLPPSFGTTRRLSLLPVRVTCLACLCPAHQESCGIWFFGTSYGVSTPVLSFPPTFRLFGRRKEWMIVARPARRFKYGVPSCGPRPLKLLASLFRDD
jgi:hypothetical protein